MNIVKIYLIIKRWRPDWKLNYKRVKLRSNGESFNFYKYYDGYLIDYGRIDSVKEAWNKHFLYKYPLEKER